jgi:hypothetical protein
MIIEEQEVISAVNASLKEKPGEIIAWTHMTHIPEENLALVNAAFQSQVNDLKSKFLKNVGMYYRMGLYQTTIPNYDGFAEGENK